MDMLPLLVIAAGALVAVALLLGRRRARAEGRSFLPVPTEPLPDTRVWLLLAPLAWLAARFLMPFLLGGPPGAPVAPLTLFLASSVVNLAVALVLFPAARHDSGVSMPRASVWMIGAGLGMTAYAAVQALGWGIQTVDGWLGRETPVQQTVEMIRDGHGVELGIAVFLAVCVAPLTEEIFYRGVLLPALGSMMPVRAALVVQALVFGVMHVPSTPSQWPLILPLAAVGWMCGAVYVRTRSLGAAVLLHAVFNGVQVLMMRAG